MKTWSELTNDERARLVNAAACAGVLGRIESGFDALTRSLEALGRQGEELWKKLSPLLESHNHRARYQARYYTRGRLGYARRGGRRNRGRR
jgi:hypothetical protein